MDLSKVPAGRDLPSDVNVLIEVPMGGEPVKYELDKESGALFVDRLLFTPMRYPCNYGFIPQTLSDDGDPCDVLCVGANPLVPGAILRARPVGVLLMEDDAGQDEKIVAVPHDKMTRQYEDVKDYTDLPTSLIDQIQHFFEHYKDLEPNKWVKIKGWGDRGEAERLINEAYARAQKG